MSPCSMYTDDDFSFEGFSETYLFHNSVALSGEKSVYNLFTDDNGCKKQYYQICSEGRKNFRLSMLIRVLKDSKPSFTEFDRTVK